MTLVDRVTTEIEISSPPTSESERQAFSAIDKLAVELHAQSAIITPMDAFNFIGWRIYLDRIDPKWHSVTLEDLIREFLESTVEAHLARIRAHAEEFRSFGSALKSGTLSAHDRSKMVAALNALDAETDFAPQVLSRLQASEIIEDLSDCMELSVW
jgi:hypothetical protein